MKQTVLLIVFIVAVVDAGVLWIIKSNQKPPEASAEAKPAEEEGAKITRDANGNAVVAMSDELQGDLGIQVTNPPAFQMSPEAKGYGRVLDAAPLAALMNELATAQAACDASSKELARLKILEAQGNASARAVQSAEATVLRDQLAVQSPKERLIMSWGKALTEQKDLPAFVQSLAALDSVLVRIDLPVGEALKSPVGARILSLSGSASQGEYLGVFPGVDPQLQGRGFLFLVRSNASQLSPGEAVVGQLKVPGDPLTGVIIPRQAVVRTEGSGWIYVLDPDKAEAFTRTEIPLDHPTDAGWFVSKGLTPSDFIVVTGAQQLLSTELRGGGAPE